MPDKISKDEFVFRAIKKCRKPPYKGIHTVYSGFNQVFREYFGEDPIGQVNRMIEAKKIYGHPAKKGVMIYLPEDAPVKEVSVTLGKILEG